MVDYKGPKLLGKSFPILVNLANDEPVPSEESYLTSSSEVKNFKIFFHLFYS